MSDLTKEEKAYLRHLVELSAESLIDLMEWEGQTLMTPEEIENEYKLIQGLLVKLNEDCD